MSSNNNVTPPSDKNDPTLSKQPQNSERKISRRTALRMAGVASIGAAAQPLVGICATTSTENGIDTAKFKELCDNPKSRTEFIRSARSVAKKMVEDSRFASRLMENTNSVQLINLFNENRDELERITGKIDGRTSEGRYTKMLVAAELFSGVSGLDKVCYCPSHEEQLVAMGSGSSSSSSCSGCDEESVLGCCIVHFWGWTPDMGGSCSPCNE